MNYNTVIVFGAHADDEITMAGTIARMSQSGVRVVVVIMTNGCEGYPRPEMKNIIVELRRQEAAECDKVLGIHRREILDIPDMGLVNDKETLQQCIKIIREERPDAIFTHGPVDRHRDHVNTHAISIEGRWHAGEPVAAVLGPSWNTPHLYYYKAVTGGLPVIIIDVTETAEKRAEALATQVSQHTLFGRTKQDFEAEAESIRKNRPKRTEQFWIADRVQLSDFLPKGI
ncbi:hypothetical protein FJZ31_34935 [Candidatus Poribacteria bacterium]|nr:hypothetical protein [Candidatus Poribacteria bacterium]